MENILNFLRNLGAGRIAMLVVAVIMLIGLFSMIIVKSNNSGDMSLLYGSLTPAESSKMVEKLEQDGIKYEIRGSSIFVDNRRADEMRLKMAGEGLVGANMQGYELFDEGSGFGTTALVQNINARRALEGELARTIQALPAVSAARVHLVMPKRKIFSKEQVTPTASVTLDLGRRLLSDEQVQSVTHLVSAAVPNLTPDNVTVVDQRGNLLSSGKKSAANRINMQTKIKRQVEMEYEDAVRKMLERIVGPQKANVKVSAAMTFDSLEEHTEEYDPASQVARSEQRSEDRLKASNSTGQQGAGVTANIPGQEAGNGGSGSNEERNSTAETINYEISKTVRKHVREGGAIERLSIAVLVEGRYTNEGGIMKYVPYTEKDIQKLERLVKGAIGFDNKRGDVIEIIDMAFAQLPEDTLEEEPLLSKEDIFSLIEYGLMIIGIFILVFVIIKPLLKATLPEHATGQNASKVGEAMQQATPAQAQGITDESGQIVIPGGNPQGIGEDIIEHEGMMIDLEQVEGKVRESSLKRVTEIIGTYPDETVTVIRGWLNATAEETEGQ